MPQEHDATIQQYNNITIEKVLGLLMLLFAVGFNLWLYRVEPSAKIDPNDNAFQFALVDRTNQIWNYAQQSCAKEKLKIKTVNLSLFQRITVPFSLFKVCSLHFTLLFDHWVPNWAQGYNLPYYYSHIPQILIVASWRLFSTILQFNTVTPFNLAARLQDLFDHGSRSGLTGQAISLFSYYHLVIYLLLSLFPLSVFSALRVIGLPWLTAGIGALLAGHISTDGLYGLDQSSYLWRGWGLSSQLFAAVFMPLSIAYSWRWFTNNQQLTTNNQNMALGGEHIPKRAGSQQNFVRLHFASERIGREQDQSISRGKLETHQNFRWRPQHALMSDFWLAVFFLVTTTAGHLGMGMLTMLGIAILAASQPILTFLVTLSHGHMITLSKNDNVRAVNFYQCINVTMYQLLKLLLLIGSTILLLGYWIIPAVLDSAYHNFSFWDPVWKFDSYGATEILTKLFNGDLFDFGRFPVLTILLFIGLFAALSRKNPKHEALNPKWFGKLTILSNVEGQIQNPNDQNTKRIGFNNLNFDIVSDFGFRISDFAPFTLLFLGYLGLYFGRTTWGGLIDLVPGMKEFHLSRMIVGVHLAGLFIIPIGIQWVTGHITQIAMLLWRGVTKFLQIASRAQHQASQSTQNIAFKKSLDHWQNMRAAEQKNFRHAVSQSLLVIILLILVYPQTLSYARHNDFLIRQANENYDKVKADVDELVQTLRALQATQPGRVFAGRGGSWGRDFRVAETPYYMVLSTYGIPTVLWLPETWSLNSDVEQYFSEDVPSHYALFNIRYVVAPPDEVSLRETRSGFAKQPFWQLFKETPSWKLYTVEVYNNLAIQQYNNPSMGYITTGLRPAIVASKKENFVNLVRLWIQSPYHQQGLYPQLVLSRQFPQSPLSPQSLPHFIMKDESIYQTPDNKLHSLFAEPPIYLPPGIQSVEQFKQTTVEQYNNATILSQLQESDMIFKTKVEVKEPCSECVVVLRQTYHPSWRATIDGKSVPTFSVFPFYTAVKLESEGSHEIVFSYQPSTLKLLLLALSAASLVALGILGFKQFSNRAI